MASRQGRHAVPGTLPLPNCFVAEGPKVTHGKRSLLGFEFLEANDFWSSFGEPSQKILQPFINVVDIESGNLHRSGLNP